MGGDPAVLRLKQIDLYGFKSFSNRERLRFSGRGIAAVVGPNGCGKSNICDAVNWVLGEQSAKSLRGSRMHDVIFNGTRNRPPAGMATVTLTLQDPDLVLERLYVTNGRPRSTKLPASKTPGEIAVTRKLFSNGESQYILNGQIVRLRDVQDLFLGTGLGPNHYAIIEQGRIGQLLSSRALDRRAFVEEAAGVTRFKARRKLAEFKLANAELNLERVHDIHQEVQRQANSLKRQAERAERYEGYRKELRDALGVLFASRYRHSESERKRLESEVKAAKAQLASASAKTDRMESEFSEKRDREREWEARLEAEREKLSGLRIDEERMRERVSQQSRTVTDNSGRMERARRDIDAIAVRVLKLEEDVLEEQRGIEKIAGETDALGLELAAKESECDEHEAAVSGKRLEQEASRAKLLQAMRDLSNSRALLGQLEETLAGLDRRLEELRQQRDGAAHRLVDATAQQDRRSRQASELGRRAQEKAARCEALREALEERGRALEFLRQDVQDRRADVSRLTARRDSLREMLEHRAYTSEAVKDIFDALEQNPQSGFHPLGILADFLEVDEGYEKAVEQFLGEDLEHVVVADWEAAGHGAQLVREEIGGRAAFLVRAHPDSSNEEPPSAINGAAPLASFVRFAAGDGVWGPGALPKLRDGYLIEDETTAERLAIQHPRLYFLLRDGTWYRGNVVQAGRKASGGPLVLKQQMRELLPELPAADEGLEAAERETGAASEAARRDSEELEAARSSLQDLEKEALAIGHDLRQARQLAEELEGARASTCEEIERTEAERASTEIRREEQLSDRARLEEACRREESLSAELERAFHDGQSLLAELQEERATLRTEAATLEERCRAREASLHQTQALLVDQRKRLDDSERQLAQWREENKRLLESNTELQRRVGSAADEQHDLRVRIDETSGSLSESRARTTALVEAVRDNRELVERASGECSAKEIELARVESDLEHLAGSCDSELGESIGEIAARAPSDLSDEALREAEERHLSVKAKIERLGPVNVLAREEFEHVSQRREFLETQQQDLLDSIRNTRQAIREIDIASRQKFDAAFEGINRHFREVFTTLFGGGVGEMRLSDPDNRNESGIDIVAQPPGKRLQNVALLSGGEKSLTVMALLMATFRYKPSPFCILDEVDSQLDEANTVRLRKLLQEMAPETQFVVITHSKTTMEVAETLYGVTMGEVGVSKLVSVRMAESGAGAVEEDREEEPVLAASA